MRRQKLCLVRGQCRRHAASKHGPAKQVPQLTDAAAGRHLRQLLAAFEVGEDGAEEQLEVGLKRLQCERPEAGRESEAAGGRAAAPWEVVIMVYVCVCFGREGGSAAEAETSAVKRWRSRHSSWGGHHPAQPLAGASMTPASSSRRPTGAGPLAKPPPKPGHCRTVPFPSRAIPCYFPPALRADLLAHVGRNGRQRPPHGLPQVEGVAEGGQAGQGGELRQEGRHVFGGQGSAELAQEVDGAVAGLQ